MRCQKHVSCQTPLPTDFSGIAGLLVDARPPPTVPATIVVQVRERTFTIAADVESVTELLARPAAAVLGGVEDLSYRHQAWRP